MRITRDGTVRASPKQRVEHSYEEKSARIVMNNRLLREMKSIRMTALRMKEGNNTYFYNPLLNSLLILCLPNAKQGYEF